MLTIEKFSVLSLELCSLNMMNVSIIYAFHFMRHFLIVYGRIFLAFSSGISERKSSEFKDNFIMK